MILNLLSRLQPGSWLLIVGLLASIPIFALAVVTLPTTLVILALIGGCLVLVGWLLVALYGIVNIAFLAAVASAVFLPHYFYNLTSSHLIPSLAIVLPLITLIFFGRWTDTPMMGDVGIMLVFLAQVIPAIVSRNPTSLPGVFIVTLGVYAISRLACVPEDLIGRALLIGGMLMAGVALAQRSATLSSLIPFTPMRSGMPYITSRGVGLFNNPNTLGNLLALVIIVTLVRGVSTRNIGPLALCLAGILATHSREAMLGLLLGMVAVYARRPLHWIVGSMAGLASLTLAAVLVPETVAHFDPRGFSTDSNLLDRITQWRLGIEAIPQSPLIGFGYDLPVDFIDNAYLGWLLAGGVIGATLWLVGTALLFVGNKFWPVIVVTLAVAILGNPFTGPSFAILLILSASSGEPNKLPKILETYKHGKRSKRNFTRQ